MIDYFKTYIHYNNPQKFVNLVNNGTFAVAKNELETATGQLIKETYLFQNMVLEPHGAGVLLYGSLHKLKNHLSGNTTQRHTQRHGGFNGDLFTLDEVQKTISELCGVLEVCPSVCTLQNIEIGLNNPVNFCPKIFLEGILYHRNNYDYIVKHGGNYVQFCHAQYYLKLYNKGKQYALNQQVIRVEVKIIKMQKLHDNGIYIRTLADINRHTLERAFDLLYKEFEEVVYFDKTTRTEALTEKQQIKALQYQNKDFWKSLSYRQRNHYKNEMQKMILQFSENLKGQIQAQMKSVFNEVLRGKIVRNLPTNLDQNTPQNCKKFTDHSEPKIVRNLPFKYSVNLFPNALSEDMQIFDLKSLFFAFENFVKKHPEKHPENLGKKCKVTGLDLGLEKGAVKYIRTTTFLTLKKHFSEIYIFLCSDLLPRTGYIPKRENNIISQLCKQVRNRYNNPNKK